MNGILQVSSMREGRLWKSTFQVGDVIVSINNISCAKKSLSLSAAASLLTESMGPLTVIVKAPDGDPRLVECMVMKLAKDSKVGLGVTRATSGQLKVSSIHPKKAFASSLLCRRDRILFINDTAIDNFVDVEEAAKLITDAETSVTVVAERHVASAAVVALESAR